MTVKGDLDSLGAVLDEGDRGRLFLENCPNVLEYYHVLQVEVLGRFDSADA